MLKVKISVKYRSFPELRLNQSYYIDKTKFIEDLLSPQTAKISLITRPRRFGKTLCLSMLDEFFTIEKQSKELFSNLEISKNASFCSDWQNKYPVLKITLKGMTGLSYKDTLANLCNEIQEICISKSYLLASKNIDTDDRKTLQRLKSKKIIGNTLVSSLSTLIRALEMHWNIPVILLIDEYDVPLTNAYHHGFYPEMAEFMRSFLGSALKTNARIKFAVLTGCLRIAKESIFTGLNNFVCFGIADYEFAETFGFTDAEVDALLAAAHLEDKKDEIQTWYDGYRFGEKTGMYCPWDILNHVAQLQKNRKTPPLLYWKNTSENDIVRDILKQSRINVADKIEILLNGGCIEAKITDTLNDIDIFASEDTLWSVLYLTGYLTIAKERALPTHEENLSYSTIKKLVIPNREIRQIFVDSVQSWFASDMQASDRTRLFDAFWSGRSEEFTELLTDILLETISYYDSNHDFCHGFLTGIFTGSSYSLSVRSSPASGEGRPDILVHYRNRIAVIEIKYTKDPNELESALNEACSQISRKKYAIPYAHQNGMTVLSWGIAFCKKSCLATCFVEPSV